MGHVNDYVINSVLCSVVIQDDHMHVCLTMCVMWLMQYYVYYICYTVSHFAPGEVQPHIRWELRTPVLLWLMCTIVTQHTVRVLNTRVVCILPICTSHDVVDDMTCSHLDVLNTHVAAPTTSCDAQSLPSMLQESWMPVWCAIDLLCTTFRCTGVQDSHSVLGVHTTEVLDACVMCILTHVCTTSRYE